MKCLGLLFILALLASGCANTMSTTTKNDVCGMGLADPTGIVGGALCGAAWLWPGGKMPQSDLKPKCGVEGCPDPDDHYPSYYPK